MFNGVYVYVKSKSNINFRGLRTFLDIIRTLRKILVLSGEKCHAYKLRNVALLLAGIVFHNIYFISRTFRGQT